MTIDRMKAVIEAARGARMCDLVLSGGRIVNVFTGRIETGDLGICEGRIAGIGEYRAAETIDVRGKYLCPGFIESHIHIESSCLIPSEFARGALARGVTTVIADPHEIANVMGNEGIISMHRDAMRAPLEVYFVLPSCVPATGLETSGASLSARDLAQLIDEEWVIGLGEVMNFPGVINGVEDLLEKIELAASRNKIVDGHAPLVSGGDLSAYLAAGIGSDHECTMLPEAAEKLRQGMFIMMREGTDARNLDDLLPLIDDRNFWFATFVGDDIHPGDLIDRGYIDYFIAKAVQKGVDPVNAVRMATIVPAMRAGLSWLGALAPGRQADVVVVDDLKEFHVHSVYKKGVLAARDGGARFKPTGETTMPRKPMNVAGFTPASLVVAHRDAPARVIGIIPGQILTDELMLPLREEGGYAVSDTDRDILKIAVIERHQGTGNIAVGFVRGFGMKKGAIGSSVGHDSHNITVVGVTDDDIYAAARRIIDLGGGQVVVSDGEVVSELALPIGGLMNDRPLQEVADGIKGNLAAARRLDCVVENPFMTLSFLPLAVIPRLKITDRGLVDVARFDFVPLYTDQ